MTKRREQRKTMAQPNVKEIVLRVDGGGWHPSTADPGVLLPLAAAYVEGLRAVAQASELSFTLKGIEIRDECVAVGFWVDHLSAAIDAAKELDDALTSGVAVAGTSMVLDRLRSALQSLPNGVSASVKVGRRWQCKLDPGGARARPEPVGELVTIRARPGRAGGVVPAVRFSADDEPSDFTLPCSEEHARQLGAHLYREVEIEASVTRSAGGHIESGQLLDFTVIDSDDDPRGAWERWFEVNGAGWDDDSVEAFIGRSQD